MQNHMDHYSKLKVYMDRLVSSGLCVAFSGGVDSSLVLKAACDVSKENGAKVYAVTFLTELYPHGEIKEAREMALNLGAVYDVVKVDELSDLEIIRNPPDRCYRCKKMLFLKLQEYAREKGLKVLADGTNADDLHLYRPGIRALSELGVISPLSECGFTKAEVRRLSRALNLKVSEKPSAPCLATRIPYNTPLEPHTLQKIAESEDFLKRLGFPVVRLRLHGDVARIEVSRDKLADLLQKSDEIVAKLKKLGFLYITLDLEGFCSGSMDRKLRAVSAGNQEINE